MYFTDTFVGGNKIFFPISETLKKWASLPPSEILDQPLHWNIFYCVWWIPKKNSFTKHRFNKISLLVLLFCGRLFLTISQLFLQDIVKTLHQAMQKTMSTIDSHSNFWVSYKTKENLFFSLCIPNKTLASRRIFRFYVTNHVWASTSWDQSRVSFLAAVFSRSWFAGYKT